MRQDTQAALDAAFRLTLDLADVTEHEGWRTARERVLAALAAGPGVVALLGPAGTGKTLLLRELARTLHAAGRTALLVGRGDMQLGASTGEVLLVDEAARMDEATLGALARPGMAAVLADLPGLEARLDGLGAAVTVVRLAPLRPDEVGAFVADRLDRAGRPAELLTAGAVEALALHSAGVPRVLNLLARAALFMAETEGAAGVEERHVSLAVELRDGGAPESDTPGEFPEDIAQIIPGQGRAACDAEVLEDAQVARLRPESLAPESLAPESLAPESLAEAEELPPEPSDAFVAPMAAEAVITEAPPPTPAPPTHPAPRSRSEARAGRGRAALLVASVLLVAALAAGWALRPQLAYTVRATLAGAMESPSPAPDSPAANSAETRPP